MAACKAQNIQMKRPEAASTKRGETPRLHSRAVPSRPAFAVRRIVGEERVLRAAEEVQEAAIEADQVLVARVLAEEFVGGEPQVNAFKAVGIVEGWAGDDVVEIGHEQGLQMVWVAIGGMGRVHIVGDAGAHQELRNGIG